MALNLLYLLLLLHHSLNTTLHRPNHQYYYMYKFRWLPADMLDLILMLLLKKLLLYQLILIHKLIRK